MNEMATKKIVKPMPQQDFLRDAMLRLVMSREQFSTRISVPKRTLDKWLLPSDSADSRPLPDMARSYIEEILAWHKVRV